MLWIKRIIFALALAFGNVSATKDEKYKAGEHCDILPQAVRTANAIRLR